MQYPVVLDPKAAALVMTMRGVVCVLRTPRKAHGHAIVAIAAAAGCVMDDDYYYFGYASEAAQAAAHERILTRIEQLRAAGREKPYRLVVTGLNDEESVRWLTLSVGAWDCKLAGPPQYGFDSVAGVEAAIARVRQRPEYRPEIGLAVQEVQSND
jgi:hypothetical protein